MNVLHLISSGGFYGAESMLLSLCKAQARGGVRPIIGVFLDERCPHVEVAERAAGLGIETRLIPCSGRFQRRTIDTIRHLLECRVDMLHCHGYKADVYGFIAALGHRVPLVSTCHNWADTRLSMRAYATINRFILRWFDQVTTPSRFVAAILEKSGVRASNVSVIENGVDVEHFFNSEPTLRQEIRRPGILIGAVGRLTAGKGGEVFLQAAKSVLAVNRNVTFVFVGEGPCRRKWETLAVELGIAQSVIFTGIRNDMPGVYESLDILVLPSLDEAMPMCLLEGLAAARSIIATPVGEVPKLITPGVTGELVEAGNAAALRDAILRLIDYPAEGRRMGRNGRELVAGSFSSEAMARKYLNVYESALAARQNVSVTARKVDVT